MPMLIKVHAGDWGECLAPFGPGWSGRYRVCFPPKERDRPKSRDYFLDTDVAEVEVVTEENRKRLLGTAGWGVAGAVALGPVGLLAGLLLGGRGRDVTFVCRFTDGRQVLATTDHKTFRRFQLPALRAQMQRPPATAALEGAAAAPPPPTSPAVPVALPPPPASPATARPAPPEVAPKGSGNRLVGWAMVLIAVLLMVAMIRAWWPEG